MLWIIMIESVLNVILVYIHIQDVDITVVFIVVEL